MPPHIVSMDSNSLMNPYRDAGLWQRSAIIPGHVLLHPRLVRVDRAAALRFGAQCAAPLACGRIEGKLDTLRVECAPAQGPL
jgi:hypothetical protein